MAGDLWRCQLVGSEGYAGSDGGRGRSKLPGHGPIYIYTNARLIGVGLNLYRNHIRRCPISWCGALPTTAETTYGAARWIGVGSV